MKPPYDILHKNPLYLDTKIRWYYIVIDIKDF
jgi:hypothetical protein